jgi:hypothetical protein
MKGKEWENCGGFGEIGRKGMVGNVLRAKIMKGNIKKNVK